MLGELLMLSLIISPGCTNTPSYAAAALSGSHSAAAGPGPGSARVPPRVIMSCAPFLPRSLARGILRGNGAATTPVARRSDRARRRTGRLPLLSLILHTADYGVPRKYFRSRRPSPIFLQMKLRD